jgi:hypothetical protein
MQGAGLAMLATTVLAGWPLLNVAALARARLSLASARD